MKKVASLFLTLAIMVGGLAIVSQVSALPISNPTNVVRTCSTDPEVDAIINAQPTTTQDDTAMTLLASGSDADAMPMVGLPKCSKVQAECNSQSDPKADPPVCYTARKKCYEKGDPFGEEESTTGGFPKKCIGGDGKTHTLKCCKALY